MMVGELLEHGYVKTVVVYTQSLYDEDWFINIYRGAREKIPSAINELTVKNWGITRGCVDINVSLQSEEERQAFFDSLAWEKTWLQQRCNEETLNDKTYCEERLNIVRKVSRNFAKTGWTTPPDKKNMVK